MRFDGVEADAQERSGFFVRLAFGEKLQNRFAFDACSLPSNVCVMEGLPARRQGADEEGLIAVHAQHDYADVGIALDRCGRQRVPDLVSREGIGRASKLSQRLVCTMKSAGCRRPDAGCGRRAT